MLELDTPQGPARAHIRPAEDPRAVLVLGHGAGGGVTAPDLVAAAGVALDERITVALIEQPYRVAGRKSPPRAEKLDEAWLSIVAQLPLDGLPLITGGRSSGARVACRTAQATSSIGVLCLAFPLHPAGEPAEPPARARRRAGPRAGRSGHRGLVRHARARCAAHRRPHQGHARAQERRQRA